jgi:uncharacterized coiled-coil DUF342 family protein
MEEMEHLTRIVSQLVEQVQALAQTSELLNQRSEQLYRLQEERTAVLPQLAESLIQARDNIEVLHEEFVQSLDQLEGTTDDLTRATAALLVLQQQANQEEASEA